MGAGLLQLDCDFHIHSRYSAGTSESMNFENIASQAPLKGLQVVGTGDALHPRWLEEMRSLAESSDGILERGGCRFVATVEVEDTHRVHHLLFLPGIAAAEGLREALQGKSEDLDKDGRPHLRIGGAELVDLVMEAGGFLGPAHAFVPWTSVYKEYDSLKACYGDHLKDIPFLELGLSADTQLADRIAELQGLTFLSNSDAHSPWPNKLGREFNRLLLRELDFRSLRRAIEGRGEERVAMNVGLDPRLGKYYSTACIRCYRSYSLQDATVSKWRCRDCGGRLKKGVKDRIGELADYGEPRHPPHRPPYLRIAPLADILALALKVKSPYSEKARALWSKLVTRFGSEIAVLLDVPLVEIRGEAGERVADLLKAFREKKFGVVEGGGGKYGELVFGNPRPRKIYEDQSMLDTFLTGGKSA